MPGIYLFFTAVLALTGSITIVSTGKVGIFYMVAGSGLLAGYYRAIRGERPVSRKLIGVLSAVVFLIFTVDIFRGDVLIAVGGMTLLFQTVKSLDMKEPWDAHQVFMICLLQLLVASELTRSVVFAGLFPVFLVLIVISVLMSHFVGEGQVGFRSFLKPILIITVSVVLLTAVSFVSLPRFRSGFRGGNRDKSLMTTGFSDHVDFGSFGAMKEDETVVMRFILHPDFPGPHYFRGKTFDRFDGVSWKDGINDKEEMAPTPEGFPIASRQGPEFEAEIFLEPVDSDAVFTLHRPFLIRSPGFRMYRDSAGALSMSRKAGKQFIYRESGYFGEQAGGKHLAEYLQIPPGMERVSLLARTVAGTGDEKEKTVKLMNFLRRNYRYSLSTRRPEGNVNVIEDFLFGSKQGYCEHFATAMTLMLRSSGVPARLVTGFLGRERNDIGDYYIVRQSDAHSWVEAYIGNRWRKFDPTPPSPTQGKRSAVTLILDLLNMAWERFVVGFSPGDGIRLFQRLRRPASEAQSFRFALWNLLLLLIAASLIVLLAARKILKRPEKKGSSAVFEKFRKEVSRSGGKVTNASTSDEVLREAIATGKFDSGALNRFINLYRELRFAGVKDKELQLEFRRLRKNLKKRRPAILPSRVFRSAVRRYKG